MYFRSKLISGLLASKSDVVRKGKVEKDIKKVDVRHLEIRASKPTKNSDREVLLTKSRRSARRSTRHRPIARSRSANRMDDDDDVFGTHSARMWNRIWHSNVKLDLIRLKYHWHTSQISMLTNNALGSFYNFHLSILTGIQDIKLTLNKI